MIHPGRLARLHSTALTEVQYIKQPASRVHSVVHHSRAYSIWKRKQKLGWQWAVCLKQLHSVEGSSFDLMLGSV